MDHDKAGADGSELPSPVVPADTYSEAYYTTQCGGAPNWARSGGTEVHGIYRAALHLAGFALGDTVVDIGTGRGDLLAVAVNHGASRAIGIEYAEAAVALAQRTLDANGVSDRAEVLLADARRVPLEDGTADVVTLLDVVEHLSPSELAATLTEARRLLRPGGRVFIHTMPTRDIYDVTYRWLRRLWPGGRKWPQEPRTEDERVMHVNEQTVSSLQSTLAAAGFRDIDVKVGDWVFTDYVPSRSAKYVYHALHWLRPLRRYGACNLLGLATR